MQHERKFSSPYHVDIPLFLILIPFISAFNYYLTYYNIRFNWFLLLTFTIDTVQGYIAWWAVRAFILVLDKKWSYEVGGLKRIGLQLFCTILIGLLIISGLTELVSWIAKGKPAPLSFYSIDLVIISIWFFVINGIYIGLHFYYQWQESEKIRQEENRIKSQGVMVKQGKQDLMLSFEELAGFYVDDAYVAACLVNGQKYLMNDSLDKVEKKLPSTYFFRLNRQYLVHRQIVSGFKRAENGKLLVLLTQGLNFPAEIPVSRIRAGAFKQWFRPE